MRWVLVSVTGLSLAAGLFALRRNSSGDTFPDQPLPTAPGPREKTTEVPPVPPKGVARPASEEDQIKAILAAKGTHEAADGYQVLFKEVGVGGLARLRSHPNDTIAVQAAWEQVELTVPEQSDEATRPDRDKLAWFLGFLEGRTRVPTPRWWTEAILDARANRRGNIYAGGIRVREARKAHPNSFPPPRATFEQRDGMAFVRVGKNSVPLPGEFREKIEWPDGHKRVSALLTPARCYIAVHEDVGYGYRLACVDRKPLKVRWATDVWGSWWGAATGAHEQWVEVTEQGDRVAVFGVACGFHVEVFRTDDGSNVFRFSNSYSPW